MPYSEATNLDQILQRRTRDEHNKSVYARDDLGNIKPADAKRGVPLSDVWDVPYLNPKAKERVGYPTQKPLLLLERIIELVTDEKDLVLDPFCGSGTTCVAAKLSNRTYLGIDESADAIQLALTRLKTPVKTESAVLKKGRKSYQNADMEALQCLAGIEYNPVHRNQGIDAILIQQYQESPVLVKIQQEGETLSKAQTRLQKAMLKKGAKKGFVIQTKLQSPEEMIQSSVDLIAINSQKSQLSMHVLQTPSLGLIRELAK